MNTPPSSPSFGRRVVSFYEHLARPQMDDCDVTIINPYVVAGVREQVAQFHEQFYVGAGPRIFVFGINPGRFGSGVTGIPFTDPVALQESCGIANNLVKRKEISSEFVYAFIERWGGPSSFYGDFFLTAVSPVGFLRNGTNFNYYDDRRLLVSLRPYLVNTLKCQLDLGAKREVAIVLGLGKNRRAFESLNAEGGFFEQVHYLEHPRFIMQYRRQRMAEYLEKYMRRCLPNV